MKRSHPDPRNANAPKPGGRGAIAESIKSGKPQHLLDSASPAVSQELLFEIPPYHVDALHRRRKDIPELIEGFEFLELYDRAHPGVLAVAIFTAVPLGRAWQVKAVATDGSVARLGRFDNRLTALGASVLLAAEAGGEVRP